MDSLSLALLNTLRPETHKGILGKENYKTVFLLNIDATIFYKILSNLGNLGEQYIENTTICKTEKETQMYRTDFWTVGEGEGGMFQENNIEACILSRVKQITSPRWMRETSAPAGCTGKTQRDRVEMEVGGGIWMGNTCKPMAVSFQCMTKSTTN